MAIIVSIRAATLPAHTAFSEKPVQFQIVRHGFALLRAVFSPDSAVNDLIMTMPYRPTAFRKQNHGDFRSRVKRIDPGFFRMGESAYSTDKTRENVLGAVLLGFGWAYLVAAIGSNRSEVEATLRRSVLTPEAQGWIISALAALLAASLVMIALHLVRFFVAKGARRKNSRALLTGAVLAFGLFHTPDVVWQTGYSMLDIRSQDFLSSAGQMVEDTFPGLNIDRISFTSSGGR